LKEKSNRAISCPNEHCGGGNIALHGYSKVKWGRRRRYSCTACGKAFGASTGTPYKGLQHPMRKFDRVASLTVEGVSKSSDSSKLNTTFIERLNLTIRQDSAYLHRRTPCHARKKRALEDHLELFRCYYNFGRPHSSLKFGGEVRTPAMQAGLAKRKLSFRDIFTARVGLVVFVLAGTSRGAYHRGSQVAKVAA